MCKVSYRKPSEGKAKLARSSVISEDDDRDAKYVSHRRGRAIAIDIIPMIFLFYNVCGVVVNDMNKPNNSNNQSLLMLVIASVVLIATSLMKGHLHKHSFFFQVLVSFVSISLFIWNRQATATATATATAGGYKPELHYYCPVIRSIIISISILAFDHFATAMLWRPASSLKQKNVWSNIMTTMSIVIWCTHILHGSLSTVVSIGSSRDQTICASVYAFASYRIVRVIFQLDKASDPVRLVNKETSQVKDGLTTKENASGKKITKNIWKVYGNSYDLTDFVDKHPGGKETIMLGADRADCTPLFQSYHPFAIGRARQALEKYRILDEPNESNNDEKTQMMKERVPLIHENDLFYDEMCRRIAKKLKEHKLDPIKDRGATWCRLAYYAVLVSFVMASGVAHIKGHPLGTFLFAVFGWLLGALGHDAGHFSVSRIPLVNDIGVWGMLLICNPVQWQHQHTFAHHSFTNDFEQDPDLHHFDVLRYHPRQPLTASHARQSKLRFVLRSFASTVLGTCLLIPIGMVTEGSLYGLVEWTDRKRPFRAALLFLHLIAYFAIIVILPYLVQPNWYSGMVVGTLHLATVGLLFTFFSQINHISEDSIKNVDRSSHKFNDKRSQQRHPITTNSWAVVQIETSNNFCTDSLFWHLVSNGLNMQIEHHLFPGLNHCHLHLIQPTVEEMCKEYGVQYKNYSSWSELMGCTLDWLQKMSHANV